MKKLLPFLLLVPQLAWGQAAVQQAGPVTNNSAVMWARDHQIRKAAGESGDVAGKMITGGFSAVGNVCAYSNTTDASGIALCLDAVNGRLIYNGTGYPVSGGGGNVVGPVSSTIGELASFNSGVGMAIKQGAAQATDNKTGSITASGAALIGNSVTGYTGQQILDYAFTASGALPGTSSIYDGARGVTHFPTGSTINIGSGIGGYIVNDAVTAVSGFPAAAAVMGVGVAASNGAKTWGINTILTDTTTGAISGGTGKALNNEFDFNVTSPNTTVLGLQLGGSSVSQPASAYGVALQPLDSPNFGTISRWTAFLASVEGSTDIFASIGAKAHTGASIHSASLVFQFKDSSSADANLIVDGSESGGLAVFSANSIARAVTITGGPGRFAAEDGSGMNIDNKIIVLGSAGTASLGGDSGWTTVALGNATATTGLFGSTINVGGAGNTLNIVPTITKFLTLTTVGAGTGKHFLCIDAATKQTFEGTGASCN